MFFLTVSPRPAPTPMPRKRPKTITTNLPTPVTSTPKPQPPPSPPPENYSRDIHLPPLLLYISTTLPKLLEPKLLASQLVLNLLLSLLQQTLRCLERVLKDLVEYYRRQEQQNRISKHQLLLIFLISVMERLQPARVK